MPASSFFKFTWQDEVSEGLDLTKHLPFGDESFGGFHVTLETVVYFSPLPEANISQW